MKRLCRCALAASLAFVLTAANTPPPVVAPVVSSLRSTATVAPIAAPTPWIVSAPTPGPGWTQPTPAPTPTPPAPTPAPPTVADAKAYALQQLGAVEYRCLSSIIQGESRWNPQATNRRSGAFGLPQALPASKMASAGADWRSNPVTQVRWMIGYTAKKYGSACGAAQFRNSRGWY